jgi:sulfite exporter TauE/SafE/copper chaperone CopZ
MSRRRAAQQPSVVPPEELHRAALQRRAARQGSRAAHPADSAAPTGPAPLLTTTVPVAGMTCRACEVRIQRHVGRIPGVQKVAASAVQGRVVIESEGPVPAAAIEGALHDAGYEIGRNPWLETDHRVWLTAAAGAGLIALVAVIAKATGLTDLAAGTGDLASGGLLVALLLGLTAGVSTCMALVGGLLLALTSAFAARKGAATSAGAVARLRPAFAFMAGRIAGYAVLGAMLGALGASVAMPPQLTAALMLAVAVLMTLIGARLTGLSPRLATWSPTLPLGVARTLGLDAPADKPYSDARAAVLGAASFFLPCGFTQAVQVFALSTGSPVYAGAIMAVFAIGTAPGLLALAGLPLVVPSTWKPTLLRVAGVVVIVFALVNASAAFRLAGIRVPGIDAAPPVAAAEPAPAGSEEPALVDGAQQLTTYQDLDGYSPGNVAIYAGIPTKWTIESLDARSCAVFLVVPDLGIQVALHEGKNEIDLPALPAGTLAYSCSMGMYGGQITIVEPPAG